MTVKRKALDAIKNKVINPLRVVAITSTIQEYQSHV